MRFSICTILLLFMLFKFSFAKDKKQSKVVHYLQLTTKRVDLFNAGIGMPPHFVNGRLHPGIQIGLQKSFRPIPKKSHADYTVHLGYFAQQSLQRAIFLKPGIGYHFHVYKNISLRPMLNLSLMTVQQINDEFKLNAQGKYDKANKMRFQMMPALGLETSVPVAKSKRYSYSITLGYEFGVQLPFSVISNILPVNQLRIGAAISPFKKRLN